MKKVVGEINDEDFNILQDTLSRQNINYITILYCAIVKQVNALSLYLADFVVL